MKKARTFRVFHPIKYTYLEAQSQGTDHAEENGFQRIKVRNFRVFSSNKTHVPWSSVARNANTMDHADFGRQNQILDVVIK